MMVLGTTLLMMGFQNCGKVGGAGSSVSGAGISNSGTLAGTGVVVGTTASYSQLTFDPNLELSTPQKTATGSTAVNVDLNQGTIVYRTGSAVKTCVLDVDREQKLKSVISVARVCHPEKPADGAVSCMAVSLADIKLANATDSDSVLLRKVTCSSGTFLCDGADDALRSILQDLLTNPEPASNCK
jgi:hypothetical protein